MIPKADPGTRYSPMTPPIAKPNGSTKPVMPPRKHRGDPMQALVREAHDRILRAHQANARRPSFCLRTGNYRLRFKCLVCSTIPEVCHEPIRETGHYCSLHCPNCAPKELSACS
jgi:hypothetical protein